MQNVRIALVQLRWLGNVESMKKEYRRFVADAASQRAKIVCLPEFSLAPYFPGTTDPSGFDWAEELPGGHSQQFFSDLAKTNDVYIIGSVFERTDANRFFDTATVTAPDGSLVGVTRKIHIPYGEGYNETTFFRGGDTYPVHQLESIAIAAPTCYDQWFPELSRIYALNGAEFIYYPTAIGSEPTDPTIDTKDAWQTVIRGQAIASGVFIAAANRTGQENGVTFYGSSFVCDPTGKILAQASRDRDEIVTADLNEAVFSQWRTLFPLLDQRRPDVYGLIAKEKVFGAIG